MPKLPQFVRDSWKRKREIGKISKPNKRRKTKLWNWKD